MSLIESLPNKKICLVSFHADWCGACQTMTPTLKLAKTELQDNIEYLEIDIDDKPQIAAAFHIRSVPSLLLFQNGEILWRHTGLILHKELVVQIKKLL